MSNKQTIWLNEPVVDANGALMNGEFDEPFTKREYVDGFYTRIVGILERNGYNIKDTNKLKKDLSRFIYNYSH
jgi:hypothetical protein